MTLLDIVYLRPEVHDGIARVVTPWSAHWLNAWVIVAMLCLVVTVIATPDVLGHRMQALFGLRKKDSIFQLTSIIDWRAILFGTLFTIISLSLTLYMTAYDVVPCNNKVFMLTIGLVMAYLLLKYLVTMLLFYVFFSMKTFTDTFSSLALLYLFTALGLFVAELCRLYLLPDTIVANVIQIITLVVVAVLFVLKMLQNFSAQFSDYLHIFLYLCTLEIIPLTILVKNYANLITGIV